MNKFWPSSQNIEKKIGNICACRWGAKLLKFWKFRSEIASPLSICHSVMLRGKLQVPVLHKKSHEGSWWIKFKNIPFFHNLRFYILGGGFTQIYLSCVLGRQERNEYAPWWAGPAPPLRATAAPFGHALPRHAFVSLPRY